MKIIRLVMKKYSRETRKFTFFLKTGSNKLMEVTPNELYSNERLMAHLNHEDREKVAYAAGMQYAQETGMKIAALRASRAASKKPSLVAKQGVKRNKLPKTNEFTK